MLTFVRDGLCSCDDTVCKAPGKHPIAHLVPNGVERGDDRFAGESQVRRLRPMFLRVGRCLATDLGDLGWLTIPPPSVSASAPKWI